MCLHISTNQIICPRPHHLLSIEDLRSHLENCSMLYHPRKCPFCVSVGKGMTGKEIAPETYGREVLPSHIWFEYRKSTPLNIVTTHSIFYRLVASTASDFEYWPKTFLEEVTMWTLISSRQFPPTLSSQIGWKC